MPKLHFCTHLQNRHNLWSFKQKKKMCLKDIFYVIYITSLFDFMLKRFHKIFANFKCVNVFCKNTEYQTSHKTKVSIVLPICTFMFRSRFFLNSSTHLHFTVTAKSLYMKSCHEPDPQWELVCDIMKMLFVCKHALGSGL